MDFLEQLNPQQRAAVEQGDGPVLIVAGPGTGKTKTLTARIAHIVATGKARPGQILALTFTKKAAGEMQERVGLLLKRAGAGGDAQPYISTFHALCHELLGGGVAFASDAQRLQIIKQLTKPAELKGVSARELGLLISRAKNMAEDDPALTKLVQQYDASLAALGLADFDDLLVRTRQLLQTDAAARASVQKRFSYILVDEFQDTNRLQYELLQLLRGNDNLFVIGDPLQSIYGFRGAGGGIFEQFRTDFPQAMAVALTVNYRSVPEVVALSNALFPAAPQLTPHSQAHGRVQAVQVLNEYSEAAWVLSEIQKAIGGGDMLRAVSDDDAGLHHGLRDFAILYRNRSAALAVQKAVANSGLPYQVVGEGSPYEQPQVLAVIALLRAALSGEPAALEGFSRTQAKAVQDLLGQTDGVLPHLLAEKIALLLGFDQSPALRQFAGSLVRFKTLRAAVSHLDAIEGNQFYDPQADVVTLLTIHASKGLEFPHVFIIGAEEGVLPHHRADPEEEKRLFYVAATRARERLDILHTMKRGGEPAELSRFVRGTPPALLPRHTDPNLAADQRRAQKRAAKNSQQSLF
ncbi:MAG TPA: ATP-dependent helicase [Candidatus Saccharimonadales bacterium]|nr:ATP-dependent helicase [Candidatus Saccharimonadales bacterium]